jgi:hypothetical protein
MQPETLLRIASFDNADRLPKTKKCTLSACLTFFKKLVNDHFTGLCDRLMIKNIFFKKCTTPLRHICILKIIPMIGVEADRLQLQLSVRSEQTEKKTGRVCWTIFKRER